MKKKYFFASLKLIKKGVGPGVGSGSRSISQRYGSGDLDPHQNVIDPQHCIQNYQSLVSQLGSCKVPVQLCANY
jgi:hypothetical protein